MPTVLFTVFSLPVTAYAVWTAAGALLCGAVTLLRARAKGIDRERTAVSCFSVRWPAWRGPQGWQA